MITKATLIPNLNCKREKQEKKHDVCKTKIQQNFIASTKQKHVMTKKKPPKINVEQTKGNGEFYLCLYPLGI